MSEILWGNIVRHLWGRCEGQFDHSLLLHSTLCTVPHKHPGTSQCMFYSCGPHTSSTYRFDIQLPYILYKTCGPHTASKSLRSSDLQDNEPSPDTLGLLEQNSLKAWWQEHDDVIHWMSSKKYQKAESSTFSMNFLSSPHCPLVHRAMSSVIKIPVLKP